MGKLVVSVAMLLFSPMVVADDTDAAINMEDSSYDNPSTEDSEDTSDLVRNPAQMYSPEHPAEETSETPVANQPDFVAPPPTIIGEKPLTPAKPVEIMKPGNHNYRAKKVSKDSGVTITFSDEQAEDMKRQKKEKDLLQKFYQMEAKKKTKKVVYKKPSKKKVAKKHSRLKYRKLTRR